MYMATFERILKEFERFYPPLQTAIEKTEHKTTLVLTADEKTIRVNITNLMRELPSIRHSGPVESRIEQLIEEHLGLSKLPPEQVFKKYQKKSEKKLF